MYGVLNTKTHYHIYDVTSDIEKITLSLEVLLEH